MTTTPNIVPSVRVDAIALFNRLNGEYVTVRSGKLEDSDFNSDYYIGRDVQFNFTAEGDQIEGNIIINDDGSETDNFKVVPYGEWTTSVHEAQLNTMAAAKITDKYPLSTQINILSKVLISLGKTAGLEGTEEYDALTEMSDYIEQCLKTNQTKKEFYENDPYTNYVSKQAALDNESRRYEGGLYEELGANVSGGGRVFS